MAARTSLSLSWEEPDGGDYAGRLWSLVKQGAEVKLAPRLIEVAVPTNPVGAVIVLHGGASRRENMIVSPTPRCAARWRWRRGFCAPTYRKGSRDGES
jgi:hypothetical protein